MRARDPKVDFIAGDVLRRPMADRTTETRRVTRYEPSTGIVEFHKRKDFNRAATRQFDTWQYVGHMRKWAATATVVRRGDAGTRVIASGEHRSMCTDR